jgi:hypothetical protein
VFGMWVTLFTQLVEPTIFPFLYLGSPSSPFLGVWAMRPIYELFVTDFTVHGLIYVGTSSAGRCCEGTGGSSDGR